MENAIDKLCAKLKEVGFDLNRNNNHTFTIELDGEYIPLVAISPDSKIDYMLCDVKARLLKDDYGFSVEQATRDKRDIEIITDIHGKHVSVYTVDGGDSITADVRDSEAEYCEDIFDNVEQFYKALVRYLQS